MTEQLQQSKRREIAEKSWEENGLIVITKDIQDAVRVANRVAPEHLELAVSSPKALLKRVRNAGAVFLGRYTPEAIGDYIAGPSHVLPTGGTARFSSGLSVYDFLTRSSVIGCSDRAFREISEPTELLAKEEGLEAHARSVKIRRGAKVAAE